MPDLTKIKGGTISTYDMLFGDMPLSYWAAVDSNEVPWNLFKEVKKNIDNNDKESVVNVLNEIINIPMLETSHQLLFNDPMAGKMMYAMLNLMNELIDKSIPASKKQE
ncbi:MAG: hypothetical protein ABI204_04715 [Ginsengibacter sp.]